MTSLDSDCIALNYLLQGKKSGKKGKKGKKEKDLTVDRWALLRYAVSVTAYGHLTFHFKYRTMDSLYEELVREGIIVRSPKVQMEEFLGEFKYVTWSWNMQYRSSIFTNWTYLWTVTLGQRCGSPMLNQCLPWQTCEGLSLSAAFCHLVGVVLCACQCPQNLRVEYVWQNTSCIYVPYVPFPVNMNAGGMEWRWQDRKENIRGFGMFSTATVYPYATHKRAPIFRPCHIC